MRFAIVENENVTNVAVGDDALADNWIQSDEAQIGWSYADGVFTAPEILPAPVPKIVTMRQARLALSHLDLLGTVDAAVANANASVKIEWEYSSTVDRSHPWVQSLGSSLGLDLDELFKVAGGL